MNAFAKYSAILAQQIERSYAIRIITRDVPDPLVGDLNGTEIHIDFAVTAEDRLFLLAHLFGHTVQWNVDPELAALGTPQQPPVPESMLPALMNYESEAAGYGLSLLHSVGIKDLDQWMSDYSACDMAYLRHYYLTGEKQHPQDFFVKDTPLLQPRPIPKFHPTRFRSRSEGIVI
ncbi:MAG: hypothetical protein ABI824_06445 [Acidobacteriota bacterium]